MNELKENCSILEYTCSLYPWEIYFTVLYKGFIFKYIKFTIKDGWRRIDFSQKHDHLSQSQSPFFKISDDKHRDIIEKAIYKFVDNSPSIKEFFKEEEVYLKEMHKDNQL